MTFLSQIVHEMFKSIVTTRGGVAKEAIRTMVVGFVIAIGSAALGIGIYIAGWIWPWIYIVSVIGLLMMLSGAFSLLTSVTKRHKTFHCPKCGTEHTLLASIEVYLCPTCDTRLLLGKATGSDLAIRKCMYCNQNVAVAVDHGIYNCCDCGSLWNSATGSSDLPAETCEQCGRSMPSMAHICMACENIPYSNQDFVQIGQEATSFDLVWAYSKSPVGHLIYAKSLLKRLQHDCQMPEMLKQDQTLDVARIAKCNYLLGVAFMSLEHICLDPEKREDVGKILCGLDTVYYDLLKVQHAWLLSLKKYSLKECEAAGAFDDMFYAVRAQIAQKMGGALTGIGALDRWVPNCVDFAVNDGTLTIVGDSKQLQKENERNGIIPPKKQLPLTALEGEIKRVEQHLQQHQDRMAG